MISVLVIAVYFIVAWIVYFWWVKQCRKFHECDHNTSEIEESGFFFAAFWFFLLPCYLVVVAIQWVLNKAHRHE